MSHGERQGRRNPVPFQQEDRGYQGLQEDGHSAVFPTLAAIPRRRDARTCLMGGRCGTA
jgi:hypothetical protein